MPPARSGRTQWVDWHNTAVTHSGSLALVWQHHEGGLGARTRRAHMSGFACALRSGELDSPVVGWVCEGRDFRG